MYDYDVNYKHGNFFELLKVIFNIPTVYYVFCLNLFFYATQPLFVFLQSEAGSNDKRDKTKSCKHQSHEGIFVSEVSNIYLFIYFKVFLSLRSV